MRLNYNDMLLLAIWEYNRRQDEDLTLELFQETFGQVPGAHRFPAHISMTNGCIITTRTC